MTPERRHLAAIPRYGAVVAEAGAPGLSGGGKGLAISASTLLLGLGVLDGRLEAVDPLLVDLGL